MTRLFWALALVLVVIVAVTISRRYGRRLTERQIIASQRLVNQAMREAGQDLIDQRLVAPFTDLSSELVANIWGHDVMAFEFQFPVDQRQDIQLIRHQVNAALAVFAEKEKLPSSVPDRAALLVTDVWYDNSRPILHLDIAHLANEQTAAYLRDLRRLNQSNG